VMALHALAHMGVRPVTTLATSGVAATLGVVAALVGNGLLALATIALIAAGLGGRSSASGTPGTVPGAAPGPADV
jgi:hypothetical protein